MKRKIVSKSITLFIVLLITFFSNTSCFAHPGIQTIEPIGQQAEIQKPSQIDLEEIKTEIAETTLSHLGLYYNRPKISKLIGKQKKIILTFDDGPHPRTTPKVLKILKDRNIKAIFFILGLQAEKYPELVKQIHEDGHELGNHTYSHKDLTKISYSEVQREINKTSMLIKEAAGITPKYFRPPYGAINSKVIQSVTSKGMDIVLWNIDPNDWKSKNSALVLQELNRQLKLNKDGKGGFVLLHDIYPSTVKALGPFLDRLATKNFQVATIKSFSNPKYNIWAAQTPRLFRTRLSNSFDLELSENELLIHKLRKPETTSDYPAMAMIKANKKNRLLQFFMKNADYNLR